ncbi:MAG: ATP-binding protein [Oligoflexia bacterium]|nr:ATP-binding protein [Oligoflexia bacterium]
MKSQHPGPDFAKLFDSAPGIYLVLLPDPPRFTMVAANQARLRATMTTLEQVHGKGLFELFPDNPDDANATGVRNLRTSLDRVVETRQPDTMAVQKYDIPRPESEGGGFEERFWSPLNSPVLDENGELIYIIHRVEDVTEFVRLKRKGTEQTKLTDELQAKVEKTEAEVFVRAQQIQESNRKLQEAHASLEKLYEKVTALDQVKTQFFANVSHEFRTPLTLILGPLDDLLSGAHGSLSDAHREQFEILHRNALRLLRLVNTLLDFSRIEAGQVRAVYEELDLPDLTKALAGAFQSAIKQAGLKLTVECPPLPTPVYADKDMWEKIVLNLVSNAFKYTLKGEITVSLLPIADAVELKVQDSGTGIPEHELPRIFERFHRVEGAQGRSYEGTGIGLSLVQELVKLHGGTIGVRSVFGQGSVFTVRIPTGSPPGQSVSEKLDRPSSTSIRSEAFASEALRWVDDPGLSEAPAAPEASQEERKRIVLAEDNPDMREYVRKLLAGRYDVLAVTNGKEALDAVRSHRPDLVVSDIMMPVMNGIELLRTLRADPDFGTTPVILLSARAGDESKTSGIELGADDYVTKPFSAKELQARIQTQLQLSEMRSRLLRELKFSNQELEAFSRSVAHDLRAPLRSIAGFSKIVIEDHAQTLEEKGKEYLHRVFKAAEKMGQLIDGLLSLSRLSRGDIQKQHVNMSGIVDAVAAELRAGNPSRQIQFTVEPGLATTGDPRLIEIVMRNLLNNAWKFTSKKEKASVQFAALDGGREKTYFIRDNGAGFDMQYADKLFGIFQRLHAERDFEGTGIGLATVRRIIERHGGRIWAEAIPDEGATFYFTFDESRKTRA